MAEKRFIFYERLFEHMAFLRKKDMPYMFKWPEDLAYREGGQTVLAFKLNEIVLDVLTEVVQPPTRPGQAPTTKWVWVKSNPTKVDTVLIPGGNGRYTVRVEPPLGDNVRRVSPIGVPISLWYRGWRETLEPGKTLAGTAAGEPPREVLSINCCMATESAFYREWVRVMHAPESRTDTAQDARALPSEFHKYFMVDWHLKNYLGGGATACDAEAAVVVRDQGHSWLADNQDMRRGDIAQIFWVGGTRAWWHKRVKKAGVEGQASDVWARETDNKEPMDVEAEDKRLQQVHNDDGHSVFIHDVIHHEGKVYFQVLSAQGNDLAKGGTRGVGLAGSGKKAYAVDDAHLQAELFAAATCCRYAADDRSSRYITIPELYVGRLRRPFPCWPVALTAAGASKVPLPSAFRAPAIATNLHADDVHCPPASEYLANCERAGSGFYPIGLSRSWHGGVHFKLQSGTPVHAIADGVIVAARCAGAADDPRLGPSRNFVLIRHQVDIAGTVKVFYSLAMHLRSAEAGARPIEARWLWQFDRSARIGDAAVPHPDADALTQGTVVRLSYPVAAGDVIGHVDGGYLHFEIFSSEDIVGGDYPKKQLIDDPGGDGLYDSKKLLAWLQAQGDLGSNLKPLVPNPRAAQSGVVLQEELVEFFASGSDEARDALRGLVTRHVSEWSRAASWAEQKNVAAWAYYDATPAQLLHEAQQRAAWLSADIARWCKLPADGVLVHYHPVIFIDWLAGKVLADKIGPVIQSVAEILAGSPAPASSAAGGGAAGDAEADDAGGVHWTVGEGNTLVVGTLRSDDSFGRTHRERGPWKQIGEVRRSANGHQEFVKVYDRDGGLWICVRSGGIHFASRVP